ncbi:MAG TPA: polyprenol monophosphomannose synthase [Rhodothermales bacterium]|nr:dolichyl-phosphate beta-D-mannosyltransferase [Bacteroidota bacterium]HRK73137.1 polyprenol monophosphomannose synthase [Rhodothermales bacterium]HRR09610.1 polyprenol monophosphomannose synthase [Rhodothermales bacterium]
MPASALQPLVIIPTYNEARNIEAILLQVLHLPEGFSVLVVDDGSPDGTADLVSVLQKEYPERIFLIERVGKQGLGTAYRTGFQFALERHFDCICEMDADFSHNPADLSRLVEAVWTDQCDLAIGSRYIGGIRIINWPLIRLIISYGASIYTRIITRMPIKDATAGFKCFSRKVLENINLERVKSNGYSFQIEMHYRTWQAGYRIKEVPVIFTERSEGLSKMSKAIMREAALKVWELRIRAMIGKL